MPAPIAAAAALADLPGRVLLHSARDDDALGRWSFVTAEPCAVLEIEGGVVRERDGRGAIVREAALGDAFTAIEAFLAAHGCRLGEPFDPEAPEPRAIGYLDYELGARAVGIGRGAGGRAWLAAYGAVARFDRDDPRPAIVGPDAAARDRLAARLQTARPIGAAPRFGTLAGDEAAGPHLARVREIREHIAAGDYYQVNLARRLAAPVVATGDPLALYAALAANAPAPYGALLETAHGAIVSGSPERFLASAPGGRIETRPIKGTLARTPGARAADLAASDKDAAEHLMIVDLERNDLGRVAEVGTVAVDRLAYVVELPALFHAVSRVSARPRAGTGYADLLRATFPGGSITGAPKLAAMAAVAALEPVPRGPYCGALGYFGAGGAFDLAIAIRIGHLTERELAVHVGGGIVTDSDPDAELAETETKAAGWRRTLAALSGVNAARA